MGRVSYMPYSYVNSREYSLAKIKVLKQSTMNILHKYSCVIEEGELLYKSGT